MKTLYDIVTCSSACSFREQVQIMLNHGFSFSGDLKVNNEGKEPLYTQAFLKEVEDDPAPAKKDTSPRTCTACGHTFDHTPEEGGCPECCGTGIRAGDLVLFGKGTYKVSGIALFPHGPMVAIYDEPPSVHTDYLKPESVTLIRKFKP